MPSIRLALGALALTASVSAAQQDLPRKYTGPATRAEISAADLMTRLYIFADDSMMGREVGTPYHLMATEYIANELRALGLVPAGDNGTYFQDLPVFTSSADSASSMIVDGRRLTFGSDFLPYANADSRIVLDGVTVVYAGSLRDSSTWISAEQARGKIVVFTVPITSTPARNFQLGAQSRFGGSVLAMVGSLERVAPGVRPFLTQRMEWVTTPHPSAGPPTVFITSAVATSLLGPLDKLRTGATGQSLAGTIVLHRSRAPARNVAAILPGSDAALRGQYVALGAHSDHIGFTIHPVDHDSVRAFNTLARPQGEDSPPFARITAAQAPRYRALLDSLRARHPARLDSIYNGADDDGTGTVSVLEIAEALAKGTTRPRRSILFVWHAGEEKGLWGSEFFTDHPTVPRDSIVAQLNLDMVGRGAPTDVTGETRSGVLTHGGPGYLQLVGSRRLSTELGDLIEAVNVKQKSGLTFDYAMDANGHAQSIYCRSDHYEYARYGIPIVFMTTGGHADYHQVTDEPQYIDYRHMAQVATFVSAAVVEIANLDHRIVVDKPKPEVGAQCVQ